MCSYGGVGCSNRGEGGPIVELERADGEGSKLVWLKSSSASVDCWCGLATGVSCWCMREGSGGWRVIPGNDPTSARISGTVEIEEKIFWS